MSTWKDFEKLAEQILTELNQTAKVKHDDHIFGHLTQKLRQIDVSIRWSVDKKDYLTIVQCKDFKKPADINTVGTFLSVINDVEASDGILVCNSGFTKDAHIYARKVGISLINLHDAESTKWARELKIPILWSELYPLVNIKVQIFLEEGDSVIRDDPLGIPLTESDTSNRINPLSTFQNYWNDNNIDRTPGVLHRIGSEKPLKAIVLDKNENIQLRTVSEFSIDYLVEVKTWLGKFEPSICRGAIDHLDSKSFTASYLPSSEIPITRDDSWVLVNGHDKIIHNTRGTLVSTANVATVNLFGIKDIQIKLVE